MEHHASMSSLAPSLLHWILGCETRHVLLGSVIILSILSAHSFPHHTQQRRHRPPSLTTSSSAAAAAKSNNGEEKTVVIAYHKPPNVITSHSDEEALKAGNNRRTVYEDIESLQGWTGNASNDWRSVTGIVHSKLHAIGRLDCDTTGLLLLTNDGGLVHHVTHPTPKSSSNCSIHSITKTYEAVIMGYHDNDSSSFDAMRLVGVDIGPKYGGMTRPVVDLTVLDHPTLKSTRVSITINEGRNRQVRRMFHSIGSGVMKLKRVQIGRKLNLSGLDKEGQWRILPEAEVWDTLGWESRILDNSHTPSFSSSRKGGHNRQKDQGQVSSGASHSPRHRNRQRK
jgi:pseudouridine synthase